MVCGVCLGSRMEVLLRFWIPLGVVRLMVRFAFEVFVWAGERSIFLLGCWGWMMGWQGSVCFSGACFLARLLLRIGFVVCGFVVGRVEDWVLGSLLAFGIRASRLGPSVKKVRSWQCSSSLLGFTIARMLWL